MAECNVCDDAWQRREAARRAYDNAGRAFADARQAYEDARQAYEDARRAYDNAGRVYDSARWAYDDARREHDEISANEGGDAISEWPRGLGLQDPSHPKPLPHSTTGGTPWVR